MTAPTRTRMSLSAVATVACLWFFAVVVEAGIATMGLQRDKMPVGIDDVLHSFERARKLQEVEMQEFLVDQGEKEEDHMHEHDHEHEGLEEGDHEHDQSEIVSIQLDGLFAATPDVNAVVEQMDGNATTTESNTTFVDANITTADDGDLEADGSDFFEVNEEMEILDEANQQIALETVVTEARLDDEAASSIVVGTITTGPRGGREDAAPNLEPTEISFMIMMEEFRYSNGAETIEQISIGTKFGFSGRIVTKAEELGVASGTCTVTSDIKKELSYCEIYHKIETDNFGGYGSVMVAGTADEVGGRFLVTGTGGSLQSTNQGYAMFQFDPAGNPVVYVLLKLF